MSTPQSKGVATKLCSELFECHLSMSPWSFENHMTGLELGPCEEFKSPTASALTTDPPCHMLQHYTDHQLQKVVFYPKYGALIKLQYTHGI